MSAYIGSMLEHVKPLLELWEQARDSLRMALLEQREAQSQFDYIERERLALMTLLDVVRDAPTTQFDLKDHVASAWLALKNRKVGA